MPQTVFSAKRNEPRSTQPPPLPQMLSRLSWALARLAHGYVGLVTKCVQVSDTG